MNFYAGVRAHKLASLLNGMNEYLDSAIFTEVTRVRKKTTSFELFADAMI